MSAAAAAPSLEVERLAGALGGEVHGVDLARPLDAAAKQAVHDAWMTHQVLFFRDQAITVDQHKAFARNFGELHASTRSAQL